MKYTSQDRNERWNGGDFGFEHLEAVAVLSEAFIRPRALQMHRVYATSHLHNVLC